MTGHLLYLIGPHVDQALGHGVLLLVGQRNDFCLHVGESDGHA